jgi:hypothetical protein
LLQGTALPLAEREIGRIVWNMVVIRGLTNEEERLQLLRALEVELDLMTKGETRGVPRQSSGSLPAI